MRACVIKLLAFHIVLSSILWTIAVNNITNNFHLVMNSIISVTLMIAWFSAFSSFRDRCLFKSFLLSLFFTIPSLTFGAAYYYSNLEIGNPLTLLAYFGIIFNMPFSMGHGVLSDAGLLVQITLPVIVLNLLFILNYAEHIILKMRQKRMLINEDETADI